MTYDLKVILKYCGRSSHDLLVLCVRSRAALETYVGGLGPLLGPMLAVLGHSWALRWRSWIALRAYVGGLGPLLGPMLAVLGRSWALCWRSWAALGVMLAVLGRS